MANVVKFEDISDKIVQLKGQDVIPDFDVAALYGVQTKEINQAVRNNPRKFPKGYVLETDREEVTRLRSKFLTANNPKSRVFPKAFTEKGLYMLATILKGDKAIDTTIAIIETFAKLRELSRTIGAMSKNPDELRQKSLMQKSGEIIDDIFGEEMSTTGTETEFEINFAVLKVKHTIKRKKN